MNGQPKEFYQCPPGSNCASMGLPVAANTVQDVITGCDDCVSIHSAFKIRTKYDQYWLKFYNQKAQNFDSDVMKLQFLR
jgi:hypothetical protein